MTDGTFAEKGSPAANREHGRGSFGGLRRFGGDLRGIAARRKNGLYWHKDIKQGLLPRFRPPARLDRVDRLVRRRDEIGARRLLRKRLAQLHEESADQRP